jgi:hypothetical protein
VTLQHGSVGHAVLAYNVVDNSDGTSDVYVYDSNRPFVPTEDEFGAVHQSRVMGSVIHMDPVRGAWSFEMADGTTWGGGNGGTIFVAPESVIPQDPSLPGLSTIRSALTYLVFGSANAAAVTTGPSRGVSYMPALDSHAIPRAGGTLITRGHPISGQFVGRRAGRYNAAAVTGGFTGSVNNVSTSPGMRDTVSGHGDTVSFDGGTARRLTLELAQQARGGTGTSWSATLHTLAGSKRPETAALTSGGALSLEHGGATTSVSFTLSRVRAGLGTAGFTSGPVQVAAGDRVTTSPAADLRTERVTIRDGRGRVHIMTLRNHARPPARLALTRPQLRRDRVTVRAKVSGLRSGAVMGVVLRVFRGRHVVLGRAVSVKRARNGRRTLTFVLPSALRGRLRLQANAMLITTASAAATTAGSVQAKSRASVRIA